MTRNDYSFLVRPWQKEYYRFYKDTFISTWNKIGFPTLRSFEEIYKSKTKVLYTSLQNKIANASFVVIDITLGLPNVYWEYGLAVAYNKPYILVRQQRRADEEHTRIQNFLSFINTAIQKEPSTYKSNKKQFEQMKQILQRYYSIPSDIYGVLYEVPGPKISEKKKVELQNKVDDAYDISYSQEQISPLSEYQYLKYLKISDDTFILYYMFDANESWAGQLEAIQANMALIQSDVSLEINFQNAKDFNYTKLAELVDSPGRRVRVTPLCLPYKLALFGQKVMFVSPDGREKYFMRFSNPYIVKEKYDQLLEAGTVVGCTAMLKHAAEMQEQYGTKDIQSLNSQGFRFDSSSELWISDLDMVLQKISSVGKGRELFGELQKKITENFYSFTSRYLNLTFYIIAFWPLTEQSMDLANYPDVSKWLVLLNDWARDRKNRSGIGSPIDRFFVVPRDYCEFDGNRFNITANHAYQRKLSEFFETYFNKRQCSYYKNIFVICDTKRTCNLIFQRDTSDILRQNAILFSRTRFKYLDEDGSDGILQFEKPFERTISGKQETCLALSHLHYFKLNKESIKKGMARKFATEIEQVRNATRPKLLRIGQNVPVVMHLSTFLKKFLR